MINKRTIIMAVFVILATISVVSATITTDMANFTAIIGNGSSGFTGFFVSMMNIFMEPPLLYFVVLGIFMVFLKAAQKFLIRRSK